SQQLPYLTAVAARTSRVRLGTGVLLLPLYRPREVAEQAGVVDLLARGRLVLAFGGGYVEREFDAFGVDRSGRGRLLEEKLGVLRRALAEGVAADGPGGGGLPVGPPPPQAGGPPPGPGGAGGRPGRRRAPRGPPLAPGRRPAPVPGRHRPQGPGPGGQAGRRLVRPGPFPLAGDGGGLGGGGRGPGW